MASTKYRNDIQGLRAVAALLVAVYHIWFHRVSGAVDLFFFISAYFMTTSLLRRLDDEPLRAQWRQIRQFWSNLLKRMLPQGWFVLVVAALATWYIAPMTWWQQMISEFTGAATFTVNWVLAAHGNDYLHAGDVPSPVQHYWAMAVQLQVYVVWPVLIWAAARIGRHLHLTSRRAVLLILSVFGAASLVYSVFLTQVNQPLAYYDTFTRLWEFAAGGIFAVVLPHLRVPRLVRLVSGWIGLLGLVSFGMLVNVSERFPGAMALVPLAFAALIFISTETDSPFSTERLLGSKPLVWLGANSYGLYLWHWPILTLWLAHNGQAQLSFSQGVVAIELAIVLAWLSTRFIETPLRRAKPQLAAPHQIARAHGRRVVPPPTKALQGIGALGLVLALVVTLWGVHIRQLTKIADATDNPGAAVLPAGYDGPQLFPSLQPSPAGLDKQWPDWSSTSCRDHEAYGQTVTECELDARPKSHPESSPTVFVLGSSHVDSWTTALAQIVRDQHWRMRVIVGPGCDMRAYSDDQLELTDKTSSICDATNQVALDVIRKNPPDAIFTVGNRSVAGSPDLTLDSRFVARVSQYRELGIPFVIARDNPRFTVAPSTCVAKLKDQMSQLSNCDVPRDTVLAPVLYEDLFPEPLFSDPHVQTIDLSDLFCPADACPAAIGGVLLYMDANHPTQTFIRSATPLFAQQFVPAIERAISPP